eukprot:5068658-Amphidinium_carterae.1
MRVGRCALGFGGNLLLLQRAQLLNMCSLFGNGRVVFESNKTGTVRNRGSTPTPPQSQGLK